ncbi:MAG: hypothetical protein M1820_010086 [Bogoriella megaspora]|nr:MAG: hypothetical protein M1820_010086 [Bogoriella megaspora]
MPSARGIHVWLCTDFDSWLVPEYKDSSQNSGGPIIDVYSPIHCGLHIFTRYYIDPPHPINSHYLLKLYVNGNHFASCGVGPNNEYQGKISFGIVDGGRNDKGQTVLVKRALSFSHIFQTKEMLQGLLEVKVHRANARRRITKQLDSDEQTTEDDNEDASSIKYATYLEYQAIKSHTFSVESYGYVKKADKQRFYEYALLDPKDAPFLHFRYHFLPFEQLEMMSGLTDVWGTPMTGSAVSTKDTEPEPPSPERQRRPEPDMSNTSFLLSAQSEESFAESSVEGQEESVDDSTQLCRRLSIPPRMRLEPTSSPPHRLKQEFSPRKLLPISRDQEIPIVSPPSDDLRRMVITTPSSRSNSPAAPTAISSTKDASPERVSLGRVSAARGLRAVVANAMKRKDTSAQDGEASASVTGRKDTDCRVPWMEEGDG